MLLQQLFTRIAEQSDMDISRGIGEIGKCGKLRSTGRIDRNLLCCRIYCIRLLTDAKLILPSRTTVRLKNLNQLIINTQQSRFSFSSLPIEPKFQSITLRVFKNQIITSISQIQRICIYFLRFQLVTLLFVDRFSRSHQAIAMNYVQVLDLFGNKK